MILLVGLGAVAALLLVAAFCVHGIYKHRWGSGREACLNLGFLAGAAVLFRYCFPVAANLVLYRGLYLHMFYAVPILAAAVIGLFALYIGVEAPNARSSREARPALAVLYGLVAAAVLVGGCVFLATGTSWQTCADFPFKECGSMLEPDTARFRFTPHEVAYRDMTNTFNSAQFQVALGHTHSAEVNDGFGYIAEITPDGIWPTFTAKNDGFVIYDDRPGLKRENRVKRIKQPFELGSGMQWLDNIQRNLYHHDPWCVYDELYPLQLDKQNPEKLTLVAPKVKFRYSWPCFFVPEWAGVVLVDENGVMEELSAEDAPADPRFKKRMRIFPKWLVHEYVGCQIYDTGYFGGWVSREGRIKVPKMPGDNQQPFLTAAKRGPDYWITFAEPAGESYALFRIYQVNALSGDRQFFQCNVAEGMVGPERAINYVKKAFPGLKWVEQTSNGPVGDYQIVEPVYLTRKGQLWFKYTVTTKECTDIIATAAVNCRTYDPVAFKQREDFERWLEGEDVAAAAAVSAEKTTPASREEDLKAIENLLREALRRLEAVKQASPQP